MEIKNINHYVDRLHEKYPDVSKKDIRFILQYGWKSLYLHNLYGGDTLIKSQDGLFFYIGNLFHDSLTHFRYYIKKLSLKIRVLSKRKNLSHDGNYYFALHEDQYQYYLQQIEADKKKHTRHFTKVKLFRWYDDFYVSETSKKYVFKVKLKKETRPVLFFWDVTFNYPKLIEIREPLCFKDILVNNNKYESL